MNAHYDYCVGWESRLCCLFASVIICNHNVKVQSYIAYPNTYKTLIITRILYIKINFKMQYMFQ